MINGIPETSYNSAVTSGMAATDKGTSKSKTHAAKTNAAYSENAAIYEDSSSNKASVSQTDNRALIQKLKAEADSQTKQLRELVEKMLLKQGEAAIGEDTLWNKLAQGGVIADDQAAAKAKEDISENGYWGVEQTSDRILSFATALAGNDPEKMKSMLDAFEKGFKQATKAWGSDLPDICQNTYSAVQDKFSKWFEDNN